MKKKELKLVKYVIVFLMLIVIYLALGLLSSLIPTHFIKDNVITSSEVLKKDGDKKLYDVGYKNECIFTFTDALMINTAYSIDTSRPMNSFLLARKNYIPGQTKIENSDFQYDLKGNEKYVYGDNAVSQTEELYGLMHGEQIEDSYEYARYWHGYLPILRTALVLFDLNSIRIIQICLMVVLVIVLAILLYKKIDLMTAIIFTLGLQFISIFVIANSINESWVFILSIVASIILLFRKEKIKDIYLFFFIIGSITNYIDFFTVPLVSYCFTATIYFLLIQKENNEIKATDYIKELVKIGFAWLLGYAMTWAAKWIIVELSFKRNLISQAIEQARYRMILNKEGKITTILKVIGKNAKVLSKYGLIILIVLSHAFAIEELLRKSKVKIDFKENLKDALPYLILFLLPGLWYAIVKQHSREHYFFVYRLLVISIINLFIIIKTIFKVKKETQKIDN